MLRKIFSIISLVLTLALLAACGAGTTKSADQPADSVTNVSDEITNETDADLEEVVEESDTAEDSDSDSNDENRSFDDIGGGLANLKSYELHYSYLFESTDEDGKSSSSKIEYFQTVIREPMSSHTKYIVTDQDNTSKDMMSEVFYLDGKNYIYGVNNGEPTCMFSSTSDNDGSDSILDPNTMISGLESAKLIARGEDVNGIKTDRYQVDEVSGGLLITGEMSSEAWVAQGSDLVVKYIGKASGKGGMFSSSDAEGSITWQYEVTSIDSVSSIELPEACQNTGSTSDIPVPSNLTSQASFGTMNVYTTSDALADVVKLYEDGLAANGWTVEKVDMGTPDVVQLNATKEERAISVMISSSEGSDTNVMINEGQ